MSDLFQHQDYRDFLQDYYLQEKKKQKPYSYREMAAQMGFKKSNFLHLVIQKKRNLSNEAIGLLSGFFNFTAIEKEYFKNLVLLNQSENKEDQKKYRAKLKNLLQRKPNPIQKDQLRFFSQWYIPAIREVLNLKAFVSNLNWIKRKFIFPLTENKIREALEVLENLGMVKKIKQRWILQKEHLTVGEEVTEEMILQYHQEMLKISQMSLELPFEQRDVSALTMSLSQKEFEQLKKELIDFREKIQHRLAHSDEEAQLVAQLNIQFFKLTQ